MKKGMMMLVVLAVVMVTTPALAQSTGGYNSDTVARDANTARRVAEQALMAVNDLQAKYAEAQAQAQAGVRGAQAQAAKFKKELEVARTQLVQAQADLVAEKHKAEVKAATDQAGKERLAVLLAEGGARIREWNYFLPTEDPITGLVRQKCPEGTTPEYIDLGTTRRFDCRPLIKASDLTVPAVSQPTSKYIKCLVWGAVGGVTVGGGSYAIARAAERDYGFWDAAGASGLGVAAGYGICLLASD